MLDFGKIRTITQIDDTTKQVDEVSYFNSEQRNPTRGYEQHVKVLDDSAALDQFIDLLSKRRTGKAIGNIKFEIVVEPSTGRIKRVAKYWTESVG